MSQPIIITDLDNTVYNWVDYFAPSFRAMVHAIARQTKIGEEDILADFKNVYEKHGSLEYSFSVQELDLVKHMNPEDVRELIRIAKAAFSVTRQKHLAPYPGVKETLVWARKNGVRVIGVTNAPIFQARQRLRRLNIDIFFYGLAGWEGHQIREDEWTEDIRKQVEDGGYAARIEKLWPLKHDDLKPNPVGYLMIIDTLKVSHKNTYVIGDSLAKDVAPAIDIGAVGIWAKYGLDFDKKNFDTLLKITHWDSNKVASVYNERLTNPNHTVSSFAELSSIVKPDQMSLF